MGTARRHEGQDGAKRARRNETRSVPTAHEAWSDADSRCAREGRPRSTPHPRTSAHLRTVRCPPPRQTSRARVAQSGRGHLPRLPVPGPPHTQPRTCGGVDLVMPVWWLVVGPAGRVESTALRDTATAHSIRFVGLATLGPCTHRSVKLVGAPSWRPVRPTRIVCRVVTSARPVGGPAQHPRCCPLSRAALLTEWWGAALAWGPRRQPPLPRPSVGERWVRGAPPAATAASVWRWRLLARRGASGGPVGLDHNPGTAAVSRIGPRFLPFSAPSRARCRRPAQTGPARAGQCQPLRGVPGDTTVRRDTLIMAVGEAPCPCRD